MVKLDRICRDVNVLLIFARSYGLTRLVRISLKVGRVVDLHIPRDKESDRPKGYAFAEYETEEIAEYAVRLFSGLVTLYNRTLKFAGPNNNKETKQKEAKQKDKLPSKNNKAEEPENKRLLSRSMSSIIKENTGKGRRRMINPIRRAHPPASQRSHMISSLIGVPAGPNPANERTGASVKVYLVGVLHGEAVQIFQHR